MELVDMKSQYLDIPPVFALSLKEFFRRQKDSIPFYPSKSKPCKPTIILEKRSTDNQPTVEEKKRRDKNYAANPIWKDVLSDDDKKLIVGCTEVKRMFFPIVLSCDGVSMGQYAKASAYVCTAFPKTLSQHQIKEDMDGVFWFIVPSNPGEKLGVSTENEQLQIKASNNRDISSLLLGETLTFDFSFSPSRGNIEPADSDFRCVLAEALGDMKAKGREGLVLRNKTVCTHIMYGVTNIVADMPATDQIKDSSGRCRTNSPCNICNLHVYYWDTVVESYVPSPLLHLSTNSITSFKSLNSAMTNLHPNDPLRILPIAMYIHKHGKSDV